MVLADTHVHTALDWFEPIEVVLFHMDRNHVDKTVLLQFNGQEDNSYIFDCARRFPGRFSTMVYIDHKRPDAPQALEQLAAQGAEGVRLKSTARSPGKDEFALWRCCNKLGWVVSCQGKPQDFGSDGFRKLVTAMPDISFALEHYARIDPDEPPPYSDVKEILKLAELPNVYIKVGGLGEICERPVPFREPFKSPEAISPFLKMFYEAFGAQRLMWASAFPGVCHNEGYGNSMKYFISYLSTFCSEEDKANIMGGTALSLFKFL